MYDNYLKTKMNTWKNQYIHYEYCPCIEEKNFISRESEFY